MDHENGTQLREFSKTESIDKSLDRYKEKNYKLTLKLLGIIIAVVCIALIICIVAVIILSDNNVKLSKSISKFSKKSSTTTKFTVQPTRTKASTTTTKPKNVCTTANCQERAQDFKDYIDYSRDACDDFYQFACGKFLKDAVIPPDKFDVSANSEIQDKLLQRLKDLMEQKVNSPRDPDNAARTYYRSCIDTDAIDRLLLIPLSIFFADNNLSFPLLQSKWNETGFEIKHEILKYLKLGLKSLIKVEIKRNSEDSSKKVINIYEDLSFMSYTKSDYESNERVQILREYYTNIVAAFNPTINASNDIQGVLQFEIDVSKLLYDPGKRPSYSASIKQLKLSELDRAVPSKFAVASIVKDLMSQELVNISINDDTIVKLYDFNKTIEILNFMGNVADRTLVNTLAMMAVRTVISYLPAELRNISDTFIKKRYNKDPSPRWTKCFNGMNLAITRIYADRYFPPADLKVIDDLILNIKAQAGTLIAASEWMDLETKREALKKASNMKDFIGYPRWILNDTLLTDYYKHYKMNESKGFENFLTIAKFSRVNHLKELASTADFKEFYLHPYENNAYYHAEDNSFTFLAGILLSPYFDKKSLRSLNYGGIGMVIGHEITHGFDDNGRDFDSDGNLRNWWTAKSTAEYEKRSQCIIDQYNKYVVPSVNKTINGKFTLGENIADLGGIKMAYMAYKSLVFYDTLEDRALPGLDFTPDQLFFLSYARTWCMKATPQLSEYLLVADTHSPNHYRIFGSLVGFDGFTKAFNCPLGSRMNPGRVCHLW